MAFTTLRLMPKTFLPLQLSLKTYLQQPIQRTIVYREPPRKKENSGKGGKIHGEDVTSVNISQISVKDQRNEMKMEAKELDGSAKKAKASN